MIAGVSAGFTKQEESVKKVWLVLCCLGAPGISLFGAMISGQEFTEYGNQQLILNGGATTLNATDTGWWSSTGVHYSGNPDYIVGYCPSCSYDYFNDFFVFSLAGVDTPITSATLSIFNADNGYSSPLSSEIYQVGSVSTPIATLEAAGSGDTAVYNALASGTVWGTVTVNAATDGTQVTITLDAAAIEAINAAEGGSLAFGGTLMDPPMSGVPEPATLLLTGAVLISLTLVRVRAGRARRWRTRA